MTCWGFGFKSCDLKQRFLTFFYLSTPFGHALAVQHPLPLANTFVQTYFFHL